MMHTTLDSGRKRRSEEVVCIFLRYIYLLWSRRETLERRNAIAYLHKGRLSIAAIIVVKMMPKHAVFLVLVLSHGLIALTNGCSCRTGNSPEQNFADATHVFIGKVFRVAPSNQPNDYQAAFQVVKLFKGSMPSNGTITVTSAYDSAACGVSISAGQTWQIWASGADNNLRVDSCGGSTSETTRNIDFLNQKASSTSRCQQSVTIALASLFTLIGYRFFAHSL